MINEKIKDSWKSLYDNGIAKISSIFSIEESLELEKIANEIFSNFKEITPEDFSKTRHSDQWAPVVVHRDGTTIATDIIGYSDRLDYLLEKFLSHETVKTFLEGVIGPNFKIPQINIRRSNPSDLGLGFHQDSKGEFGLNLLLSDCPTYHGTTWFLRKSHRISLTIRELFVFPRLPLWIFPRKWVDAAIGKRGDAFFFFNDTWHARGTGPKSGSVTSIFVSFFPPGSEMRVHNPPKDLLAKLGSELKSRCDMDKGVKRTLGSNGMVLPSENNSNLKFQTPNFQLILSRNIGRNFLLSNWAKLTKYFSDIILLRRRKAYTQG